MKLYLKNGNKQNAYNKWMPGGIPYDSWKDNLNNQSVVVPKNVKNDLPSNDKNCKTNCKNSHRKSQFIANPIKHYRKQYTNLNNNSTGFSNQSYIGSLDKPGGTSTTTADCNNLYQKEYNYILDLKDTTCKDNCFIIKSASTVIDKSKDYSASNKELLRKKHKTFNQNLSVTSYNSESDKKYNCSVVAPSNKKYKVQGALTSSSRTANIRYCAQDVESRRCYLPTTDYNKFSSSKIFNLDTMPGCNICHSENGKIIKNYSRPSNIRIIRS